MVIAMSTAVTKAFAAQTVEPILIGDIGLPPRVFLRILDFSAGAGSSIEVIVQGDSTLLFDGFDYNAVASGSNEACASEINIAIIASVDKIRSRLEYKNTVVAVVGGAVVDTLVILSSNSSFADTDIPDGPSSFTFCTGTNPIFGHIPSMSDMTNVGQEIDPVSREYSVGEMELDFVDDGMLRLLSDVYPLKGRKVIMTLGTAEVPENDFFPLHGMFIEDIIPDGNGKISLKLADGTNWLAENYVNAQFISDSILEVMDDLIGGAGFGGFIDGFHYDKATFATDLVANTPFAHLTVSRFNEQFFNGIDRQNAVNEAQDIWSLVQELVMLTGTGTLRHNETGLLEFKYVDPDAIADRIWQGGPDDGHDITKIDQLATWEGIVNEIRVNFMHEDGVLSRSFGEFDQDAINQFARVYKIAMDTQWCNATYQFARFISDSPNGQHLPSSDFIPIVFGGRGGYAGARFTGTSQNWTQKPEAVLGPGKHAFIRFEPPGRVELAITGVGFNDAAGPTIYACSDVDVPFSATKLVDQRDPHVKNFAPNHPDVPFYIEYLIDASYQEDGFTNGRAGLGTDPEPEAWGQAVLGGGIVTPWISDVTVPVWMAQKRLTRFKFGAPRLRVRTNLSQIDMEISDVIRIDGDELFLSFGVDGLANKDITWEITKKEFRIWESSPGVIYELTQLADKTIPASVVTPQGWTPSNTGPTNPIPAGENLLMGEFAGGVIDFILDDENFIMEHD